MRNKNAQIGLTLTWFVAFLVIFFVMILFLSATFILSSTKGIKINEEAVKYDSQSFESQRVLLNFLDTEATAGGNLTKEMIKGNDFSGLGAKIIRFVQEHNFECFIFRIEEDGEEKLEEMELSGLGGSWHNRGNQESFLEQGSNIFLISNDNKMINVRFSGGACFYK